MYDRQAALFLGSASAASQPSHPLMYRRLHQKPFVAVSLACSRYSWLWVLLSHTGRTVCFHSLSGLVFLSLIVPLLCAFSDDLFLMLAGNLVLSYLTRSRRLLRDNLVTFNRWSAAPYRPWTGNLAYSIRDPTCSGRNHDFWVSHPSFDGFVTCLRVIPAVCLRFAC